jgi:hypothetical protein
MGNHHAVLGAADPRRVGFQEHLHGAQIQRPPSAPSLTGVLAAAPATADPASTVCRSRRPNMRDEPAIDILAVVALLLELDMFDDGLLNAQQGAKYPGVAHAVLRSPVPDP